VREPLRVLGQLVGGIALLVSRRLQTKGFSVLTWPLEGFDRRA